MSKIQHYVRRFAACISADWANHRCEQNCRGKIFYCISGRVTFFVAEVLVQCEVEVDESYFGVREIWTFKVV